MHRRLGLLILLTAFVVLVCVYSSFRVFHPTSLPFRDNFLDAHTAEISSIAGIPMPAGLREGDRMDFAALPLASRVALGATLPLGHSYDVVVRRDGVLVTVPVTSMEFDSAAIPGLSMYHWIAVCFYMLMGAIVLLALWRGRDRAAAGLVLWGVAFLAGVAAGYVPSDGTLGVVIMLASNTIYLLARVGFYMLVEAMVASALTPRMRTLWRWGFALMLTLSALQALGGRIIFGLTGWAELLRPEYGFALTASYLVPVALLFVSYRHAAPMQKLRLRWVLWGSVFFTVGIFLNNTPILGFLASAMVWSLMFTASFACILYAVLRHRVVDVAVILDRTLVYGAVTALVVGVLAAVNSLVQHATLGTNASLLLQVVVPFALGIVLYRVRTYADKIVEQVFFRKRYLAEKVLRSFARRAGHISDLPNLQDATLAALRTHVGTPGVALYEQTGKGYVCVKQAGAVAYPKDLDQDDPALVAARADMKAVDLAELTSRLGADGYVFPLLVAGGLQGVLVCANRPGEHFALDERKLIAKVARQVGLAWQNILARENQAFVRAMAQGALRPEEARERALKLEAASSGAA